MQAVIIGVLILIIVAMLIWKGFLWWLRPKMSKLIMTFYRQSNTWLTWKDIKIETGLSTDFVIWTLLSLSAPHMPMRIRARSELECMRLSQLTRENIPQNFRPEDQIETIFFEFQFDFRRGIGGRSRNAFMLRQLMPRPALVPV